MQAKVWIPLSWARVRCNQDPQQDPTPLKQLWYATEHVYASWYINIIYLSLSLSLSLSHRIIQMQDPQKNTRSKH